MESPASEEYSRASSRIPLHAHDVFSVRDFYQLFTQGSNGIALYTLDCATTLTSLYGPSNGTRGAPSPVPPPVEKIWKIASASEDTRFSFAPHDNSLALMVSGRRETFFVHKVQDWPLAPLSRQWPDVDEYDVNYSDDDSFDEAVPSEEEEEQEGAMTTRRTKAAARECSAHPRAATECFRSSV